MSITCRIDYLQGTFYFSDLSELYRGINYVSRFIIPFDNWYFQDYGFFSGENWEKSFLSLSGFRGGYRLIDGGLYKGIFFISGNFLSRLDFSGQCRLVRFLKRVNVSFTRCDIALDDYSRRISFDEVKRCGDEGLYQFFSFYQLDESKLTKGSSSVPTCYFGSPKSSKRLRFYNAEVVVLVPLCP